jgi:hypothetical protein
MRLTTIPTELTTAATDAVLAVLAAGCILYLARWVERDRWRVMLWCSVLALLALSAALGAIVHAFELSLWATLYLLLGLTVALFVVAAAYDWRGVTLARRLFVPMVLVAGVFFAITRLVAGTFLVFVVYEGAAMFLALGVYVVLAWGNRLRGAAVVALGIALNIVAAGIQASRAVAFTAIWPFDHNGVFHLVQMLAVLVLVVGVRRGLEPATPPIGRPA